MKEEDTEVEEGMIKSIEEEAAMTEEAIADLIVSHLEAEEEEEIGKMVATKSTLTH